MIPLCSRGNKKKTIELLCHRPSDLVSYPLDSCSVIRLVLWLLLYWYGHFSEGSVERFINNAISIYALQINISTSVNMRTVTGFVNIKKIISIFLFEIYS